MSDYFVDSTTGDDGDNGTTMDLAWATLEHALEAGGLGAGDIVWVRRIHSETPTSDIAPIYDGSASSPLQIIGWPRNSHSISSSDWTNGSTTVTIDDNDMDREKHQGRYITAPDGETYLITKVSATNTIIIDREYAGSTASNQTVTIQPDEDYDLAQAIDDSGWTIQKSDYNGDADDLPLIDFNDGNYNLNLVTDVYYIFKNLELKDSGDNNGVIAFQDGGRNAIVGCLLKQTAADKPVVSIAAGNNYMERCIIEGNNAGSACRAVNITSASLHLKDCAFYGCSDNGLRVARGVVFLENVNIGVEVSNGDTDIELSSGSIVRGKDVKLGGNAGYVAVLNSVGPFLYCGFENYQKVLGEHRTFFSGGYFEKADVASETPNKKVSDYIIKIVPSVINFDFVEIWAEEIFCHEFEAPDSDPKSYKYWLYNNTGNTLNSGDAKGDIWLKLEYVKEYDDTSEYVIAEAFSTETNILDAADADDWDYLQVSSIAPATSSKVRIRCYISTYQNSGAIYIDPAVVIS